VFPWFCSSTREEDKRFLMYSHAVAAAHSQVPLEKIEDKGVGHQ